MTCWGNVSFSRSLLRRVSQCEMWQYRHLTTDQPGLFPRCNTYCGHSFRVFIFKHMLHTDSTHQSSCHSVLITWQLSMSLQFCFLHCLFFNHPNIVRGVSVTELASTVRNIFFICKIALYLLPMNISFHRHKA